MTLSQRLITYLLLVFTGFIVLYPVSFLILIALNIGDPFEWPPSRLGLNNFAAILDYLGIVFNTLRVCVMATVLALVAGFINAWAVERTELFGRKLLAQLMVLPYYVTPLVGALAWAALAGPRGGLINQVWYALGGQEPLVNIFSPPGVAWAIALYEGSVAFVMISAALRSFDATLEETAFRVTMPMLLPAVLGAAIYVFVETLGAFSAPAILGLPDRFYVITTAIWTLVLRFPPSYPLAAALGLSLFLFTALAMYVYTRLVSAGSFVTIGARGFRLRRQNLGPLGLPVFAFVAAYALLAVMLPVATLVYVSFLSLATIDLQNIVFTLDNYRVAVTLGPIQSALKNSLILGVFTASAGVVFMGLLSWIIYRSRVRGLKFAEYVVMFPQSVPRFVFGLGMLLAWIVLPVKIYGTLWLLLLAYITVFLPLGVRTISGFILQVDRTLEECARVCGASWLGQLRTVTFPLLLPGMAAAWNLLFIASVREVNVSILLMGPDTKVIGPAIISSWESSGLQLTAAMAVLQMVVVFLALTAMLIIIRRITQVSMG
ncbi:MAG: hypothetical protein C4292_00620 [Nitrososphaera sp.]